MTNVVQIIGFNCLKAVIAGNAQVSNGKETEKVFLYGREVPTMNLLKFGKFWYICSVPIRLYLICDDLNSLIDV